MRCVILFCGDVMITIIRLSGWKRGVTSGIIFLQFLSTLLLTLTPGVRASEYQDYQTMSETMAGLQNLINEQGIPPQPSPPSGAANRAILSSTLPALGGESDDEQVRASVSPEQDVASNPRRRWGSYLPRVIFVNRRLGWRAALGGRAN